MSMEYCIGGRSNHPHLLVRPVVVPSYAPTVKRCYPADMGLSRLSSVSNGSYFPRYEIGACAWIIASPDGREWIEGGGLIHGEPHKQNSYRSQIGGQLDIASLLHSIQLPPSSYHITTVCDGLAALESVDYVHLFCTTIWSKNTQYD